ncbi:hypothetical protein [Streptomyces sp. FXY-T5]|uniref:hypothetical protein n=1 Tax=Streptomyces sp. FXY-T5 TaxID=3064901 RepID=UPI0027D2AE79|nr:hypothetical protein [Streptomyces sp. FXY-T5]WMD09576.1 hypothetical protein Q7C01_36720 [Streptomyces sp. FXY-T5]
MTWKYHHDRNHFDQHRTKVRSDPSVILRTVLADGAAAGHAGSIRVPEKCGFIVMGKSRCFARARDEEIDLVHLTLS